jgi:hypothetical protein
LGIVIFLPKQIYGEFSGFNKNILKCALIINFNLIEETFCFPFHIRRGELFVTIWINMNIEIDFFLFLCKAELVNLKYLSNMTRIVGRCPKNALVSCFWPGCVRRWRNISSTRNNFLCTILWVLSYLRSTSKSDGLCQSAMVRRRDRLQSAMVWDNVRWSLPLYISLCRPYIFVFKSYILIHFFNCGGGKGGAHN